MITKKVKDLKQGEYFTLKPIECPTERQVYVRDYYERSEKKYYCGKFINICEGRFLKGDKEVYVDFIF